MKKTLAILALALFIGGISVPAIAANSNSSTLITLQDDDPKKKEKAEKKAKGEKKAEGEKNEASKSGDCSKAKESDCSSKCGGEK